MSALDGRRGGSRIVSLWEMLRIYAEDYIAAGEALMVAQTYLALSDDEELKRKDNDSFIASKLKLAHDICIKINLNTSANLIAPRLETPPKNYKEVKILHEAFVAEIKAQMFMFIPPHAATYHEKHDVLSSRAKSNFPSAYTELLAAGNCYAADLPTGCVFHAVRAAEIGLWALARRLRIKATIPIELQQWHNLIEGIEARITDIGKKTKAGRKKDKELAFYSPAAAQFRYIKDGWRIRVAHARVSYSAEESRKILENIAFFIEGLSQRLKER